MVQDNPASAITQQSRKKERRGKELESGSSSIQKQSRPNRTLALGWILQPPKPGGR